MSMVGPLSHPCLWCQFPRFIATARDSVKAEHLAEVSRYQLRYATEILGFTCELFQGSDPTVRNAARDNKLKV